MCWHKLDHLAINSTPVVSGKVWNDYEINDQYIDDELIPNNTNDTSISEPSPGPAELNGTLELDHYFLDPEGLNLIDPLITPQEQLNTNDITHAEDPEPSPFDPC